MKSKCKVIASIAPKRRAARARRACRAWRSGFRSSAWNTTPAAASDAPTSAAASTRGQPRDEEDLRVGVVGERNRPI